MAVASLNSRRREVVTLWMRQVINLHERMGSEKPAAAGWIGAVYALRAAARLDANAEWGRLGDEIINHLEQAYLSVRGPEGQQQVDAGRKLLQTQKKPELPKVTVPTIAKKATSAPAKIASLASRNALRLKKPMAARPRPLPRAKVASAKKPAPVRDARRRI